MIQVLQMKKAIASMIAIATILLLVFSLAPMTVHADAGGAPRTITVNGQGAVRVKPDVAYITVGVQTDAELAKDAQAENSQLMNAVIEAIKAMDVADTDIQTSGYFMFPQYNYGEGRTQRIVGYTVSNNVNIVCKDIDKAGDLLNAAINAGANMTNNIQFGIADPAPYYEEALMAALDNAKLKANIIAKAMDINVGIPSAVTEQYSHYAPVAFGGGMKAEMEMAMAAGDGGMALQTGEIEVTAALLVEYSY